MKRLSVLFVFITSLSFSQETLSDQAYISVITFGPGQEAVFTAFGHSAFRVYDPVNGIDHAYNYGVFDFDQPNFYLNFARGHNYYRLGIGDYRREEYKYIYYNRYIHEQILNLTPAQTQRLYDYLRWNARPENQYYLYDYFYDNCATRLRDVIKTVFGDSVSFDGSYIKTDYTIRELTDLYLKYQPWGDLGIDIGLGLPMDKVATPYEYMFLPDYVESGFAHAFIDNGNSREPLVRQTLNNYEPEPVMYSNGLFQPLYVFGAFLFLTGLITYRDFKRKKLTHGLDVFLFTILGILGLLLFLLWVATDHKAAAKNFNLLWALPTHLVAVFAFIKRPKWLEKYFLGVTMLSAILIVSWPFLPQKLHYSLIPLVVAIMVRAFTQFYLRRKSYHNFS